MNFEETRRHFSETFFSNVLLFEIDVTDHDHHEHDHHHRDHRRNHYNHTLSQQGRTLRDKKRKHQRKVCPYFLRKHWKT